MASAARRIMLKLPIRLTVIVFVNVCSGCAPSLPTVLTAGAMPAQLTRPNSVPIHHGLRDPGHRLAFDGGEMSVPAVHQQADAHRVGAVPRLMKKGVVEHHQFGL